VPFGKLVLGPRTELYDLTADPSETRDLAAARPEKRKELQAALDVWWKDTGAKFPVKNPAYNPTNWWTGAGGEAEGTAKAKKKG
jgi:hypothetical protein